MTHALAALDRLAHLLPGTAPGATPAPTPSPTATCGPDPGTLCTGVLKATDNGTLARLADFLLAKPLSILVIVAVAVAVRLVAVRLLHRLVQRAVSGTPSTLRPHGRGRSVLAESALLSERRSQRMQTMGSVLRSAVTLLVYGTAFVMVLDVVGIPVAPILASASILGVAVGFGAQNLVRDFLSGIFMILEDQYGVGDVIDAGPASGSVESVGLRVTRLRAVDGVVWHVRNGEIARVGNMSQGWSRAVLDIPVAYHQHVATAREVIGTVAEQVWESEDFGDKILERPEVWGVEDFGADGVVIRLVVKTAPLQQWVVAREVRERIKDAFDEQGIEIPFPQRSIWVRTDGAPPASTPPQGTPPQGTPPQGTPSQVSPPQVTPSPGSGSPGGTLNG